MEAIEASSPATGKAQRTGAQIGAQLVLPSTSGKHVRGKTPHPCRHLINTPLSEGPPFRLLFYSLFTHFFSRAELERVEKCLLVAKDIYGFFSIFSPSDSSQAFISWRRSRKKSPINDGGPKFPNQMGVHSVFVAPRRPPIFVFFYS